MASMSTLEEVSEETPGQPSGSTSKETQLSDATTALPDSEQPTNPETVEPSEEYIPPQFTPEPTNIAELLEHTLIDKTGLEKSASEVLKDKIIAFYFSAFWSPPCKDFTPVLAEFYEELCQRGAPFEIVFVSCDTSEEDMMEYFTSMHGDWWAVPYDSKFILELRDTYEITVVPKLVVVKSDGEEITTRGRKEVTDKNLSAFLSWYDASDIKMLSPSKFNLFETGIKEEEDRKARALLREQSKHLELAKKNKSSVH